MESKRLTAPVVIPADIQELSRQIEQWRSTRPHRMPMPEPLWTVAANLARQYGVGRVARFLRLDYYSLKERLQPKRQQISVPGSPTFIELPLGPRLRLRNAALNSNTREAPKCGFT